MKRRYKFYRYIICIMILVLLSGLAGCRLAIDRDNKKVNAGDVLCGAFLTFERGEDMRKNAITDTDSPGFGGGVMLRSKDLFEGRSIVKGVRKENTVKFEDINGYFIGFVPEVKGNASNIVTMADNGFIDLSQNINVNDYNEEMVSKATFLVPTDSLNCFYIYPVYKKQDETFYTVLEKVQGVSFTGDIVNSSYSSKIEDSVKDSLNGNITKSTKNSIEITVKTVDPVKKIVLKEMNSRDEVITTADIKNDGSSKIDYKVTPATDYVIVEETLHNNKTGDYVKRSIYSFGKEKEFYHQCNFPSGKDYVGAIQLDISK
ncbi:hypothetical protein [Anaerocolumna xylanovorans]|uniref:Uncharacterized protein n=1 Tax=Anaerocolumna xylanovorans DSM 12503 TaxID=1121345 RepID=A0A1M7XZF9_9FIRM|nr:hypothetical protein [Anaerocolumna xylanovorans]SHO44527.1 hypothetical protein SAMN02745217_00629 [Anaerocolumna xylanovorans DSM 12503]